MPKTPKFTMIPWEGKQLGIAGQSKAGLDLAFVNTQNPWERAEYEANAVLLSQAGNLYFALKDLVDNDPEFATLDKGIGTDTPDGKRRMKAREILRRIDGE